MHLARSFTPSRTCHGLCNCVFQSESLLSHLRMVFFFCSAIYLCFFFVSLFNVFQVWKRLGVYPPRPLRISSDVWILQQVMGYCCGGGGGNVHNCYDLVYYANRRVSLTLPSISHPLAVLSTLNSLSKGCATPVLLWSFYLLLLMKHCLLLQQQQMLLMQLQLLPNLCPHPTTLAVPPLPRHHLSLRHHHQRSSSRLFPALNPTVPPMLGFRAPSRCVWQANRFVVRF